MKQTILFAIIISGFVACTPTKVVNSWRDPDTTIKNTDIHKVVVAALIYDQSVRRQVEDYMVKQYPGTATQSYMVLGGDSLLTAGDQSYYDQRLKSAGYDGIVMMRQTSENTTQHYVPGQMPSYYHTWGGYWGYGWGNRWGATWYNPGTPGHVATDRTWHVEVNVYSIDANKLVWSANTTTTDPGGRVPLFEDVCKAMHKQMKSDGFLN